MKELENIKIFMKDQNNRYLTQGVLILYIAFWLPDASYKSVVSFNNVIVRLLFIVSVVMLSLIDEFTSAILLSMAFVLSVQKLNNYKLEKT
jgi:hypothetical protein